MNTPSRQIDKLPTGINGFDFLADGGLPANRTTLVSGTSGSAKTVFAAQFLVEGMRQFGHTGVFVTFEETPEDIRRNMASLGMDIAALEAAGQWRFVDATPVAGEEVVVAGEYDLSALMARMSNAVKLLGASRVAVDSLGAIFAQFTESQIVRRELFRIASGLKEMGVTTIMTAERLEDYGPIARFGVEEFVADNVIVLRNVLEDQKRRRTLEIFKFRGTSHFKGEFPFTIVPGEGLVTLPIAAIELKQGSTDTRIGTGSTALDKMCGGGLFRDSIILVSGATGCGKTLLTTEFIAAGIQANERCLLLAFEESHDQLFRNAASWGKDFASMEAAGQLKVIAVYPESKSLEDHQIAIKKEIERFRPQRIAVDSLSALERMSTIKSFREFVIGLTSFIKHKQMVGLFTATTGSLMGGESVTEAHISTITDTIILLRYVEMFGDMRRGITVLKMRGSNHDKEIREYTIDGHGMHILKPFRNVTGILAGRPRHVPLDELERMGTMFGEGS